MEQKKLPIRKIAVPVALIAAIIIALLVFFFNREDLYRIIKLLEMSGIVTIDRDGQMGINAYMDMNFQPGDVMHTGGGDSYSRLALDDSKFIFVARESDVAFEKSKQNGVTLTRIKLERGSVVNEIEKPLLENEEYLVTTPNTTMACRGTRYRVAVYEGEDGLTYTRLMVLEGKVSVRLVYPDGSVAEETVVVDSSYEILIYHDKDKNIVDYVRFTPDGKILPPLDNMVGTGALGNGMQGADGGDISTKMALDTAAPVLREIDFTTVPDQTMEYLGDRAEEGTVYDAISNEELSAYMELRDAITGEELREPEMVTMAELGRAIDAVDGDLTKSLGELDYVKDYLTDIDIEAALEAAAEESEVDPDQDDIDTAEGDDEASAGTDGEAGDDPEDGRLTENIEPVEGGENDTNNQDLPGGTDTQTTLLEQLAARQQQLIADGIDPTNPAAFTGLTAGADPNTTSGEGANTGEATSTPAQGGGGGGGGGSDNPQKDDPEPDPDPDPDPVTPEITVVGGWFKDGSSIDLDSIFSGDISVTNKSSMSDAVDYIVSDMLPKAVTIKYIDTDGEEKTSGQLSVSWETSLGSYGSGKGEATFTPSVSGSGSAWSDLPDEVRENLPAFIDGFSRKGTVLYYYHSPEPTYVDIDIAGKTENEIIQLINDAWKAGKEVWVSSDLSLSAVPAPDTTSIITATNGAKFTTDPGGAGAYINHNLILNGDVEGSGNVSVAGGTVNGDIVHDGTGTALGVTVVDGGTINGGINGANDVTVTGGTVSGTIDAVNVSVSSGQVNEVNANGVVTIGDPDSPASAVVNSLTAAAGGVTIYEEGRLGTSGLDIDKATMPDPTGGSITVDWTANPDTINVNIGGSTVRVSAGAGHLALDDGYLIVQS